MTLIERLLAQANKEANELADLLNEAAQALAQPQQEPVAIHQWRKPLCCDWYDGYPDDSDGGGPYETRTLYTPQPAPVQELAWQPMDTAPRDGTIVRLNVLFEDHSLEDGANPVPTIGANHYDNNEIDEWQFAGWCWSHDCFTEGIGKPLGWLPMLAAAPPSREPLTHGDLDLFRQWFGCIQDTNPSYIGRNDCALAAKLYKRLGLPIPKELQGVSANGINDTPSHTPTKLALDALQVELQNYDGPVPHIDCAITALREALAQPQQEPVAWMRPSEEGYDSAFRDHSTVVACKGNKWEGWVPLYTFPPAKTHQEPVGMTFDDAYASLSWEDWRMRPVKELLAELHRLTSPPSREPLTEEEIDYLGYGVSPVTRKAFARAIEAAHGIKDTP